MIRYSFWDRVQRAFELLWFSWATGFLGFAATYALAQIFGGTDVLALILALAASVPAFMLGTLLMIRKHRKFDRWIQSLQETIGKTEKKD